MVTLLNPLQDVHAVLAPTKGLQNAFKVANSADRAWAAAVAAAGTLAESCSTAGTGFKSPPRRPERQPWGMPPG